MMFIHMYSFISHVSFTNKSEAYINITKLACDSFSLLQETIRYKYKTGVPPVDANPHLLHTVSVMHIV